MKKKKLPIAELVIVKAILNANAEITLKICDKFKVVVNNGVSVNELKKICISKVHDTFTSLSKKELKTFTKNLFKEVQ